MFTGIIKCTGKVISNEDGSLKVHSPEIAPELKKGGSISVDGVCLTAVEISGDTFTADYMPETAKKTIIKNYNPETLVNLELPMSAGGRFEGHIVTGHVDGTSEIDGIEEEGNSHILKIRIPSKLSKYIVKKGSITINGISLTVADINKDLMAVCIIPHTWEFTDLHDLNVGDRVNIETDILAKHLERLSS